MPREHNRYCTGWVYNHWNRTVSCSCGITQGEDEIRAKTKKEHTVSSSPASAHFGPHNPNSQEARDTVKAHGFHFYHGTVNGTEDILALPEKSNKGVSNILSFLQLQAKRNPGFLALDFAAAKAERDGSEEAKEAVAAIAKAYYDKTVGNLRELWLKSLTVEEVAELLKVEQPAAQWSEG